MWWRRSAQPVSVPAEATYLPSTEVLRVAALQASWRRDRAVGRRRVVWRWTLWYTRRWGPLVGGIAATILAVVQWPVAQNLLTQVSWPRNPPTLSNPVPVLPAPLPAPPLALGEQRDASPGESAETSALPVRLQMTVTWSQGQPHVPTFPLTTAEPDLPEPSLKFETWLHSKEI